MLVHIINIGDELLSGRTVNTNLITIANKLFTIGLTLSKAHIIPDTKEAIIETLRSVWQITNPQSQITEELLVIITGGLGPTKDDITKQAIADFFEKELIFDEEIFEKIKQRFQRRNTTMPEINKIQAYIPKDFIPLQNDHGTAPGMFYTEGNKYLYSLPGVPKEMEAMLDLYIISKNPLSIIHYPLSISKNPLSIIDLHTHNISESAAAQLVDHLVPPENVSIGYYAQHGRTDIRISGTNTAGIQQIYNDIYNILKDYIWGVNQKSPIHALHHMLMENGKWKMENDIPSLQGTKQCPPLQGGVGGDDLNSQKILIDHYPFSILHSPFSISTAESCTGGLLSSMLTSLPGSSIYYKGSVIAYSNEVKIKTLGVSPHILEEFGAVSSETALAMLQGCKELFNTNIVCAITGIAGPDGGTDEKPVGTVFVGINVLGEVLIEKCHFYGNRDEIRIRAAEKAALMVLKWTMGNAPRLCEARSNPV